MLDFNEYKMNSIFKEAILETVIVGDWQQCHPQSGTTSKETPPPPPPMRAVVSSLALTKSNMSSIDIESYR